jgi:hypothetical protein
VHVANALVSTGEFSHLGPEQFLDQKHLEDTGLTDHEAAWRKVHEEAISTMKAKEIHND